MIKVCHIVNHITGRADGVYAHLKMIFENSDKNKFRHFLIFQGGERIEKELINLGVKFFVCESLSKKISVKAFFDIYRILKENNINIIHAHLIKPYAIAGIVNILLCKKFVFNYHGLFISKNIYYNWFEKLIYLKIHFLLYIFKVVDAVLVPSEKSKELLLKETKLFPEPIVYYNGYSFNKSFSEPNRSLIKRIEELRKNKTIISIIGRLEVDKRIDKAVFLIKRLILKKENVHLLIFGDGRLIDELKNLVDVEGLNGHITFLGFIEDIKNYYYLFNIALFTSDWEGMPLTMWEAMANKVPVVAPDVGGFREILEVNNCGLVYKPGNLNEAENKLLKLLNESELRVMMGDNGFEAIKTKYSSLNFIEWVENVYKSLMKV